MESTSNNISTDDALTLSTIVPNNKPGASRKRKGALPASTKTEQLLDGMPKSMSASNDQLMCTPDAEKKVEDVIKVPIKKVSILKFSGMVIKGLTRSRTNANERSTWMMRNQKATIC